jgi:hypothetical protein
MNDSGKGRTGSKRVHFRMIRIATAIVSTFSLAALFR